MLRSGREARQRFRLYEKITDFGFYAHRQKCSKQMLGCLLAKALHRVGKYTLLSNSKHSELQLAISVIGGRDISLPRG